MLERRKLFFYKYHQFKYEISQFSFSIRREQSFFYYTVSSIHNL